MKRILCLLLFCILAQGASAQNYVVMKKHFANTDVSTDTVTNTGTNYLGNLRAFTGDHSKTVIVASMSGVVTGVLATFTMKLQGSNDGTNFVVINGTSTGIQTGTYTGTAASSQKTSWTLDRNPFPYYRITCTGDTVGTVKISGVIITH